MKYISTWLSVIIYFLIISEIYFFGFTFLYVITTLMALVWGDKCSEWASKIKKNVDIAYIVGFLFGFLGFVVYWIKYKNYKKRGVKHESK